jgi:hypothetical protein
MLLLTFKQLLCTWNDLKMSPVYNQQDFSTSWICSARCLPAGLHFQCQHFEMWFYMLFDLGRYLCPTLAATRKMIQQLMLCMTPHALGIYWRRNALWYFWTTLLLTLINEGHHITIAEEVGVTNLRLIPNLFVTYVLLMLYLDWPFIPWGGSDIIMRERGVICIYWTLHWFQSSPFSGQGKLRFAFLF